MKAIYCAGEQGKVVLDILRSTEDDNNVVFVDDNQSLQGQSIDGVNIIGGLQELSDIDSQAVRCIVAFGDNQEVRLEIANKVADLGFGFFNAIHDSTTVSEDAELGVGIMINGQTYIGPGAEISNHVLIDSCVNISHDVIIQQGATITPSASLAGGVKVGNNAFIGPNATVLEGVIVEDEAVIGAGAVVTKDVPSNTTVVGTPASPI